MNVKQVREFFNNLSTDFDEVEVMIGGKYSCCVNTLDLGYADDNGGYSYDNEKIGNEGYFESDYIFRAVIISN
mgnify:CR=1 FL=1